MSLSTRKDNISKSFRSNEREAKLQKKDNSFVLKKPDPISKSWDLSKEEEKNFGKIVDYCTLLKVQTTVYDKICATSMTLKGVAFSSATKSQPYILDDKREELIRQIRVGGQEEMLCPVL